MEGTHLSSYRIDAELGTGGMGKVYRAEVATATAGLALGTTVALKVIYPHLLETPGFFKRFLREARIGQQVQHENVVHTFDCDATLQDGVQQNFLVMEYVEGQTLRDLLQELERVPEDLCRHVAHEIALGLAAIHAAGAVHRDIKPENVLITKDHVVKVMDLGVAHLQDEIIRLSQAGRFVGSLEYAAPEQIRSSGEALDGRADLFALGAVLYELSTGKHPFRDEDMRRLLRKILDEEPRKLGRVNPQLSPFFEEVVATLLAKDRALRFATAADLAQVLEDGHESDWWTERAKALRVKTRQPLRRIHIPRETSLYGRDNDLQRLRARFEEAQRGEARVLLIEGEAGIGKTRLVDEFVGLLREEGQELNFLFGAYPPGGAATAAGAFSTAYREQFGAAALEGTLEGYLVETPLLVPAFAALLRGDSTPTGAQPLTKDSLQLSFVRATQRLAAERTTIILIDDLHFAPEDGLALFAGLATALEKHRVLLVGTSRPGLSDAWVADLERNAHFSRLALARLGPKDLIQLLTDSFHSSRLAAELGAEIALKSDGNPFFTFEIIKGLREGQFITQGADGTWSSTDVIREIEIPSSVTDLIQARLSDLSEEQRDLLEVASCCGFEFDPLLVGGVLGLAQIPTMKRFARIEKRHRLVRSRGRRYAFDHNQVQEALYRGMPELLREPYHAKLAEALEVRSDEPEGAVAVELVEHALAGRDGPRVARHLAAAMRHLADGYLHDDAIALGQRALAVEGLLAGRERVEALLRNAASLELRGRHEEDRRALAEALALAQAEGDPKLEARVRIQRGRLGIWLGELDTATASLSAALDLAREAKDDALESTALGNLGIVHYREGAYDAAEPLFRLALERASERGDKRGMAVGTLNLGNVAWCRGQFQSAREQYQRYGELSNEIGYREGEALAAGNLGNVLLSLGDLAGAHACYRKVLSMAASIGDRRKTALFSASLAGVELLLGRFESAREALDQGLTMARTIGLRREEAVATLLLAEVDGQEGASESARARARAAATLFEQSGEREGEVRAHLFLAQEAHADGRDAEAARHLDEARNMARTNQNRAQELMALAYRACLPGNDAPEAEALFAEMESSLAVQVRMQVAYWLFRATRKRRYLDDAHDLLEHLRAHVPRDADPASLDLFRLHRQIQDAWSAHP